MLTQYHTPVEWNSDVLLIHTAVAHAHTHMQQL